MTGVDMLSMMTDMPSLHWLFNDDLESASDMSFRPISRKLKRCAIWGEGGTYKISETSVRVNEGCLLTIALSYLLNGVPATVLCLTLRLWAWHQGIFAFSSILNARSRSFIIFKVAGVIHGFILWVIVMVRMGASSSEVVCKSVAIWLNRVYCVVCAWVCEKKLQFIR